MSNLTGQTEKQKIFYEKIEKKLQNMPPIIIEYYLHLKAEQKSYMTIGVYINNIIHFLKFIDPVGDNRDFYKYVKISDIENYMISSEIKNTGTGLESNSESVLQTRWSTLNTFFEWLIDKKYVTQNPVISVKRVRNKKRGRIVNLLTKEELKNIYSEILNIRNVDFLKSVRDMAIFYLAVAVGLKTSEISNLNIQDIDIENSKLCIKDNKHVRNIEICIDAAQALNEWLITRNEKYSNNSLDALFLSQKNNRISCDAMNDALLGYCKKAGIKRNVTINDFRSTAVCQLLKSNVHVDRISEYFGVTSKEELVYFMQELEDLQINIPQTLNKLFD